MKKIIVIVLVIVLSGIAVYEVYNLFLKRTPEKLLKQQFNISLKDFDYSIETFEEQWCPNGDGELLIVIKFNELTQKNIEYFKSLDNIQPLPVSEMECWDFSTYYRSLFLLFSIPQTILLIIVAHGFQIPKELPVKR